MYEKFYRAQVLCDRILGPAEKKRQVHGNMAGPIFRSIFPGMTRILESRAYTADYFS